MATIFFVEVRPIELKEMRDNEYKFTFVNLGPPWVQNKDNPKIIDLFISYRPSCLEDNAINFGLVSEKSEREENYQSSIELLKNQVETNEAFIFGLNARSLDEDTYITSNVRTHYGHMRQKKVVWAVGTYYSRTECLKM